MKKLTTEKFIQKAKQVHGDKYDYSKSKYTLSKNKIIIICPEHGKFEQISAKHVFGEGCRKCGGTNPLTKEIFIKRSNEIHNNKYDYSNSKFANTKSKLKIKCLLHGEFSQSPERHMIGAGCPKCANKNITTEEFIKKAKEIFGEEYDYSKTIYSNSLSKIKIICPEHGLFEKTPKKHLSGQGCGNCSMSSGEKMILKILKNNNNKFNSQHKFKDCISPITSKNLKFDFYLLEQNTCIEYNGLQHFVPITYFGGKKKFKIGKIMDDVKEMYCKNNHIPLIIIFKENENTMQYSFVDLYKTSEQKLKNLLLLNGIIEISPSEYNLYKNKFL